MLCSLVLFVSLLAYTEGLQCQSGVQFSANVPGVGPITSKLTTQTCTGFGSQCLRVDINVNIQGVLRVPYVVGQCVPNGGCSAVTCDQIERRLLQQLSQTSEITSCTTHCCSTNNCNAPETGISPTPVVTSSTTLPMVPGTRRCQSGGQFSVEVPGSRPIQSHLTTVDCSGVGNQCLRVDLTARISGRSVPYVFGQCVRNGQCSAITCSRITSEFPQFSSVPHTIESCSSHCCSKDNCNAEEVEVKRVEVKRGSGHMIVSSFQMLFFYTFAAILFLTMVK